MVELLFEDIFTIIRMDPDGKKFDRVSRIEARSEQFDMHMLLDVNTDIYPLQVGDKFTMALSGTLSLDGTPDDGTFDQSGRKSLADKYEYVMYGKLYKFSDQDGNSMKVEVYVSFGGLLMLLKGDPTNLENLNMDQRLYLLMRKRIWSETNVDVCFENKYKTSENAMKICRSMVTHWALWPEFRDPPM